MRYLFLLLFCGLTLPCFGQLVLLPSELTDNQLCKAGGYRYYGIYAGDNREFQLKKIGAKADIDRPGLRYVIGVDRALKEGKFQGRFLQDPLEVRANDEETMDHFATVYGLRFEITKAVSAHSGASYLQMSRITLPSRTRPLVIEFAEGESTCSVNGIGDFDQDGYPDYLLGYTIDDQWQLSLHLSASSPSLK